MVVVFYYSNRKLKDVKKRVPNSSNRSYHCFLCHICGEQHQLIAGLSKPFNVANVSKSDVLQGARIAFLHCIAHHSSPPSSTLLSCIGDADRLFYCCFYTYATDYVP